jgi:hypothetical protein
MKKEVQRPGVRGGRWYRTSGGRVRYGVPHSGGALPGKRSLGWKIADPHVIRGVSEALSRWPLHHRTVTSRLDLCVQPSPPSPHQVVEAGRTGRVAMSVWPDPPVSGLKVARNGRLNEAALSYHQVHPLGNEWQLVVARALQHIQQHAERTHRAALELEPEWRQAPDVTGPWPLHLAYRVADMLGAIVYRWNMTGAEWRQRPWWYEWALKRTLRDMAPGPHATRLVWLVKAHDVLRPGIRGGRWYRTKTGRIRYGVKKGPPPPGQLSLGLGQPRMAWLWNQPDVRAAAYECLRRFARDGCEHLAVVGTDLVVDGEEHSVKIPKDVTDPIAESDDHPARMFVHNHPSRRTLSRKDINFALGMRRPIVVVALPDNSAASTVDEQTPDQLIWYYMRGPKKARTALDVARIKDALGALHRAIVPVIMSDPQFHQWESQASSDWGWHVEHAVLSRLGAFEYHAHFPPGYPVPPGMEELIERVTQRLWDTSAAKTLRAHYGGGEAPPVGDQTAG